MLLILRRVVMNETLFPRGSRTCEKRLSCLIHRVHAHYRLGV